MGKLEGKVALVTGSGRNIGRATVLKLAGEGAHVVVNARSNQQEAEAVAREARDLGVKAVPVLADVGKKAEVEALAAKALSEFGQVDILINNAAIRPHKPFTETTDADWELIRSVVLDGALYLTRALIEPMVKKKKLTLNVELPRSELSLHTDRTKVKQILLNLLSNAVKFTHHGGIWVTVSKDEEDLRFDVRDTGIGIREVDLESIWEDFRQVDQSRTREFGGTGLGLSITRKLVDALGGHVFAESVYGKGSTFTVVLPIKSVARADDPPRVVDEVPQPPRAER